jgi:hypothetical protein
MNKFIIACIISLFGFAVTTQAAEREFGWQPSINSEGKTVGMFNVGESGGLLNLVCDAKTHKLKMSYSVGSKVYDMFIFRKFGVTDMTDTTTAGKFFVGSMMTTQGDVYYNVMNADKAFSIAFFPVGSKAKWDKAVSEQSTTGPEIEQEGTEMFLTGETTKVLLKTLTTDCPVNFEPKEPVF